MFVPNATTALNVVLRSAGLGPGTALYMLDIGYGSVKKMAAAVSAPSVAYPHIQDASGSQGGLHAAVGSVDIGANGGADGTSLNEAAAHGAEAAGCEVVMGQVRFPIR